MISPRDEHRDAIGELRDHAQVVLDHQHRAVGGDALDQRRDALDVLVRHARGRLVEQHHLRLEREGGRDLERALAPVGQLHRDRVVEPGQAHRVEQLAGAAVELVEQRARFARNRTSRRACAAARCARSRARVRCGNTAEIWNERDQPHARDRRRPGAGDVAPVVEDPAAGRLEEMREQVEAGGLAGAVGADQGVDAAAADLEVDVLDRDETLELLGQLARFENALVDHARGAPSCDGLLPPWPRVSPRSGDPAIAADSLPAPARLALGEEGVDALGGVGQHHVARHALGSERVGSR